ncbi:hypothetical protein [Nocardioides daeguensis]|uniref:Uncharacterized protein n=1 Tax=Nocardioides daeguensis TaxID=908359 RepID=A0ABP6WGD2_9ACTN|nr:hypothetical protein [Nocardioides daeguensis]MBV6729165.1 hypothetical protein [Nocardioides daeguensis]MCR1774831.1 hypothetical protein [Nocardioides daeguensis]
MAEWNSLREVGEDVSPPTFESLVRTARSRDRRTRIAAVTAALALVVGAGVGIGLRTREQAGPPQPVHDPAPVVELPDGVRALPAYRDGEEPRALEAGRYRVPISDTLAIDVDLPSGSQAEAGGRYIQTTNALLKTEIATDWYGVAEDPCHGDGITPVGPSVEELVEAIRNQPGLQVGVPEPVTVGGAEGQYLMVRIAPGFDASGCRDGQVNLPGIEGTNNNVTPTYVGEWWILDAGGQRVVLQSMCDPCAGDPPRSARRIVGSITFGQ